MEIRAKRLAARIGQTELARAAGLSQFKLCRFEQGQSSRLTLEEVERLRAALVVLVVEREVQMQKAIT
jgi:predicted transcriptional regulator